MFSFGIEPSIDEHERRVELAARGLRGTAPGTPRRRASETSTLLCRWTFGSPGISAEHDVLDARLRRRGDRDRVAVAAHALRDPEDVDLLDARGAVLVPTRLSRSSRLPADSSLLELERLDEQLLARATTSTSRPPHAAQRSGNAVQLGSPPRSRGSARRRHLLDHELRALDRRALGDELERERRARPARPGAGARPSASTRVDAAPGRVLAARSRRRPRRSRARAPQQILGSGSPTSWSITRLPPNAVSTSTTPGGSVLTSPISAASSQPGTARSAASAASAALGRDERDELALVGDVHRVDARAARAAPGDRRLHRHGAPRARASRRPTRARARSSTEATPPRVASRRQRSDGPGGVEQRVDRGPQRARVGLDRRRRARTRRGRA